MASTIVFLVVGASEALVAHPARLHATAAVEMVVPHSFESRTARLRKALSRREALDELVAAELALRLELGGDEGPDFGRLLEQLESRLAGEAPEELTDRLRETASALAAAASNRKAPPAKVSREPEPRGLWEAIVEAARKRRDALAELGRLALRATENTTTMVYVRQDGSVDWEGALQGARAATAFSRDLWYRINGGGDPEDEPATVPESVARLARKLEVVKKNDRPIVELDLAMEQACCVLERDLERNAEVDKRLVAEFSLLEAQLDHVKRDPRDLEIALLSVTVADFVDKIDIELFATSRETAKSSLKRMLTSLERVVAQARKGITFYADGSKLLATDVAFCLDLLGRAVNGDTLAPRDVKVLRRTIKDLSTTLPFIIILLIPLTPVGHVLVFGAIQRFFPEFFPSCYTERRQNLVRLYTNAELARPPPTTTAAAAAAAAVKWPAFLGLLHRVFAFNEPTLSAGRDPPGDKPPPQNRSSTQA